MNIYDFFIIFFISASTIIGVIRGFLREMLSFGILYLVSLFFFFFYPRIIKHFSFISNFFLKIVIIFFIMSLVILFLESSCLFFFNNFFIDMTLPSLNNFILGFIFGFLRGIILILYFLIFLNKICHVNSCFYYQKSFCIPILLKIIYFMRNIKFF
ncbi:CvpA family protein [Buchnera aphidicola]|uniref:CvpA family protein n=1 Tax=Buchnera aphidicola TaxID=9 RepID=UPI0032EAD9C6